MIQRRINEGECVPTGFGIAWLDPLHRQAVCYPLVLNIVMSWLRAIWLWVMRYGATDWYAEQISAAMQQGHDEGRKDVAAAVMASERAQWEAFHVLVHGTAAEAAVEERLVAITAALKEKRL